MEYGWTHWWSYSSANWARRCVSGNSNRSFSRSSTGNGGNASTKKTRSITGGISLWRKSTHLVRLGVVEWPTSSSSCFEFCYWPLWLCSQLLLAVAVARPKRITRDDQRCSKEECSLTSVRRFNSGTPPSKMKIGLILKCNNLQIRCNKRSMCGFCLSRMPFAAWWSQMLISGRVTEIDMKRSNRIILPIARTLPSRPLFMFTDRPVDSINCQKFCTPILYFYKVNKILLFSSLDKNKIESSFALEHQEEGKKKKNKKKMKEKKGTRARESMNFFKCKWDEEPEKISLRRIDLSTGSLVWILIYVLSYTYIVEKRGDFGNADEREV